MPETQLSPARWFQFMLGKLDAQAAAVKPPTDYYNGIHKLSFATAKYREAFARFFPPLANNWMKLVVDTPVSRLAVEGFRFDPDPSKPGFDQDADQDARAIWQANNLDAGSQIAHTEAVKCGVCNILVTPREGEEPLITVEHPSQSYVFCDYADRHKRLAAIKRWVDEIDGYAYAYLFLPDYVYRYRSTRKVGDMAIGELKWTPSTESDDPVTNNPIGVVPMVPIENAPDLIYGGRSDLEVAMPIQDQVNKLCLDMMLSSEYHAYPQRWAAGWEAVYDADGKQVPGEEVEMRVGQSRLIRANSPETTFGTFETGEVDNYIKPIEMFVDHLAAVTQTPAYYLKGKMANLSAEALHAADAGLIDRCNHKILSFGDGWEDVMRVAFLAKGDAKRGKAKAIETIWRNPEVISIAQAVDAAVKIRMSLSAPVEFAWEMIGWSQQRIMQAKSMMNLPESPAEAARRAAAGGQPVVGRNDLGATSPGGVVLPASAQRSNVAPQR